MMIFNHDVTKGDTYMKLSMIPNITIHLIAKKSYRIFMNYFDWKRMNADLSWNNI